MTEYKCVSLNTNKETRRSLTEECIFFFGHIAHGLDFWYSCTNMECWANTLCNKVNDPQFGRPQSWNVQTLDLTGKNAFCCGNSKWLKNPKIVSCKRLLRCTFSFSSLLFVLSQFRLLEYLVFFACMRSRV